MLISTRDVVNYLVPKFASGKALDVGAGTAKYQATIKKSVSSYETLDINPGPNVNHVGDAKNMKFTDASYDTVFCFQMLEHVDDPYKVVGEFFRILNKKGVVIATMPFIACQHSDPFDYWRYSVSGGKYLFTQAGFKVIECAGYGGLFTVLGEFLKFIFLNPYKKKRYGIIRTKIILTSMHILWKIDKLFSKWKIQRDFYPNIYVVAVKE